MYPTRIEGWVFCLFLRWLCMCCIFVSHLSICLSEPPGCSAMSTTLRVRHTVKGCRSYVLSTPGIQRFAYPSQICPSLKKLNTTYEDFFVFHRNRSQLTRCVAVHWSKMSLSRQVNSVAYPKGSVTNITAGRNWDEQRWIWSEYEW